MSAQDEYVLIQRIVSVMFQRGHMMTRFTIEYLLRQLTEHIERMIELNDAIERNHLDDQVLLLQQLNEFNERRRNEQQQEVIQQQNLVINMDVDEDDGSSVQTELHEPFTFNPINHINPINTINPINHFNPPIYRRLLVSRVAPLERSKVIARRKLEEPCPAECSICQETPKYKDAVCTECTHYYCKGCWESWMNTEGSNKKCPTCRKDMPAITIFKGRAPNRRHVV